MIIIPDATITVDADTSQGDSKLRRFWERVKTMFKNWDKKIAEALTAEEKVAKKVERTRKKIEKLEDTASLQKEAFARTISDSMRLLNLILSFQKETALVSVLQTAQQVVQTGIAINVLRIEAAAAFAAGRKFSAFVLGSSAVSLGFQFVAAQQAESRAKELRDYTQGINTLREGYVG